MVGDLVKDSVTLLTPLDVPVVVENSHNPAADVLALITEDFLTAQSFADEETRKGHGCPVRWEKVGREYHVIVRFK